MRPRIPRLGLIAVVAGTLALGCQSTSPENLYPKDPLLLSKKPVQGTGSFVPAVQVAKTEPAAPPVPAPALASAPVSSRRLAHHEEAWGTITASAQSPTPPTQAPRQPTVVAQPAVRSNNTPAVTASPAVRRQVTGNYGHAPDYRWLQGIIDKHYHGHFDLRYCDPTHEDKWGGKVCLEDDPRLARFQEGDVVVVEGTLVPPTEQSRQASWNHYPRYRIDNIWPAAPLK